MLTTKNDKIILTVFRVFFSLIFVVAGINHVFATAKVAARLSHSSFAPFLSLIMPIETHVLLAGVLLLLGGLGLMLGSWIKQSAFLLLLVLVPITITVQLGGEESVGPLFKNIAIMGGLLYFSYFGSEGWGFDAFLHSKKLKMVGLVTKLILVVLISSVAIQKRSYIQLSPMTKANAEVHSITSKRNLAILIRDPKHLNVAVMTAKQGMKGKDGIEILSTTIVVCGKPGVEALKVGSPFEENIQDAHSAGIRIAACGLSLKQADLKRDQLLKSVDVVDNGLWEIIKLQAQGSITVEL